MAPDIDDVRGAPGGREWKSELVIFNNMRCEPFERTDRRIVVVIFTDGISSDKIALITMPEMGQISSEERVSRWIGSVFLAVYSM
jgi:hypothetical protein